MQRPMLYLFAGLPGTGKTTLARMLATSRRAAYLRIDTIEQGLRDLCDVDVEGEGYRLSYRVAADNLRAGVSVVADSCNPIELTRDEWENVARQNEADWVNIEIVCSDTDEHRQRLERRTSDIDGLELPTWQNVMDREYHPWCRDRIIIDTARRSSDDCFAELALLLDDYPSG